MNDDPEKLTTLGLARDRFLDSVNNSTDDSIDDEIDPEEAAEDFALQQKELAEKRRVDQANRALGLTDDEREDLWASFRDHQWIINCCNIAIGILFILGVHSVLIAVNKHLAGSNNQAQIQLFYQPAFWWFFPAFGGFCLAWEITLLLWAIIDSRKVHLYRIRAKRLTFNYKGSEINAMKFNQRFILFFILPLGFATLLALNMHATLGPDAIREYGYAFKPCKVYSYVDVRRITSVAAYSEGTGKSKEVYGKSIVLDFKDGRRWSTSDWGDQNDDVDPAIVSFLKQKIALPVGTADRIDDIPPLARQ